MRSLSVLSLLGVAILLAPTSAKADDLVVTIVGSTGTTTFTIQQASIPIEESPHAFQINGVVISNGGGIVTDDIDFYDTHDGGGIYTYGADFGLGGATGGLYGSSVFDGQLYTLLNNDPATPVFLLGTFALSDTPGGTPDYSVTIAQAPEPSSLLLLGSGALGLVGAARRRLIA